METRTLPFNLISIDDIKFNEKNPRVIQGHKMNQLKKSIQEFPDMLEIRPLVINKDNVVLGGNMRLQALIDLGYTNVPCIQLTDVTPEQEQEFIIKDNVGYGEWNYQSLLTDEWNTNKLDEWGLEFPEWTKMNSIDNINFNMDVPKSGDTFKTLKLEYNQEEYDLVYSGLITINSNKNTALLTLLQIN